jgi:hypothetical protein
MFSQDQSRNAATCLMRVVFADGVSAPAIEVRRLIFLFALGAAILARRYQAQTSRVCALLAFFSCHLFFPGSNQQPMIQRIILVSGNKGCCAEKHMLRR